MSSPQWTEREDRIVASKLDYPDLSYAELRTALKAIGCTRTLKGIESRLRTLRHQREAALRPQGPWLTDPFLTRRRSA